TNQIDNKGITSMRLRSLIPLLSMLVLAVAGCDRQPEQQAAPEQRRTLITTTVAELRPVQLIEHSIGVIEAIDAPTLTAEVAGQVTRVLVDVGATVRQGDQHPRSEEHTSELQSRENLAC